jgi:hypothetical protein
MDLSDLMTDDTDAKKGRATPTAKKPWPTRSATSTTATSNNNKPEPKKPEELPETIAFDFGNDFDPSSFAIPSSRPEEKPKKPSPFGNKNEPKKRVVVEDDLPPVDFNALGMLLYFSYLFLFVVFVSVNFYSSLCFNIF